MNDPRSTPASGGKALSVLALIAILVPLALGLLLSWHSLSDVDIWLHDRIGGQLLAGKGTPENADLTFSAPDHPWMNHETAFQLLAAALAGDRSANPPATGWNVLRSVLTGVLLVVLLAGDGLRRRLAGRSAAGAWIGLPLLAGLALLWPRLILRPELVSYTLFVLVVRRTEHATSSGDDETGSPWLAALDPRRPAGSVVWLTVVWAWFHGFAALAPVMWLLGSLLAALERRIPGFAPTGSAFRPGRWLPGLLLAVLALAATPNGLQGLLHPIRVLGQFSGDSVDLQRVISEMVPLLETKNSLHATLWCFRISLVWALVLVAATWGRISLLRIALVALAAWGAMQGQRNLGFYAVAFCLLHTGIGPARGFSPAERLVTRLGSTQRRRISLPLAGLGVALTLGVGGFWAAHITSDSFYLREGVGRRFGAGLTPAQYPLTSADRVARDGRQRLFSNLGGAAVLLDRTDARLFLDGRTEAHPAADWRRYGEIRRGGPQALEDLARMRVDGVLIGGGGNAFGALAATLLASDRWRLAAAEEAGLLFAPADPGHAAATDSLALGREAERLERDLLAAETVLSNVRFADRCLALARMWSRCGQVSRQERILRRGLDRRPDHAVLQHNLGNVLMGRERWAEAQTAFETALRRNPRLAGSALNLGVCRMSAGRTAEAADAFARAVRIDPELFEGWVNLGLALERTGKPAEALGAMRRALELRPGDRRLRNYVESHSR